MKLIFTQQTREGGRQYNQDRSLVLMTKESILLLIADGMGSIPNSELAAQVVLNAIAQEFQREAQPKINNVSDFLERSLKIGHERILKMAKVRNYERVPGTTIIAAVIQNDQIQAAFAGDSRLYLFDKKNLLYKTKDHSVVQQLIDAGRLDPSQISTHPKRNQIFNCLGVTEKFMVEHTRPMPFFPTMSVLLCTDGLWSNLNNNEMCFICSNPQTIQQALTIGLREANIRAGKGGDNLTAIVFTRLNDDENHPLVEGFVDTASLGNEVDINQAILDSELRARSKYLPEAPNNLPTDGSYQEVEHESYLNPKANLKQRYISLIGDLINNQLTMKDSLNLDPQQQANYTKNLNNLLKQANENGPPEEVNNKNLNPMMTKIKTWLLKEI
jgi:serine/threonine protein phosphatase PrpC